MNDPSSFIGYQVFRASTGGNRRGGGPAGGPGCGMGCFAVAFTFLAIALVFGFVAVVAAIMH